MKIDILLFASTYVYSFVHLIYNTKQRDYKGVLLLELPPDTTKLRVKCGHFINNRIITERMNELCRFVSKSLFLYCQITMSISE